MRLLGFLPLVAAGCFYVKPAWSPPLEVFVCPADPQQCLTQVTIETGDLTSCFGTDTTQWPAELDPFEYCVQAGLTDCTGTIFNQSVDYVSEPCCAYPDDVADGTADCCPDLQIADVDYLGERAAFIAFLGNQCGGIAHSVDVDECAWTLGNDEPIATNDECSDPSTNAYGGEVTLVVDPSLSLVVVDSPTLGSFKSYLKGSGSVASNPHRFLQGFATGTDVVTSAGPLTDIQILVLGETPTATSGGSFVIPSKNINDLEIQGYLNGQPRAWDVKGAGAAAQGQILPAQGTWHLDYSTTTAGHHITIHLEGDAIPQ